MEQGQLSWIANFIWGIADDVLRDLYVRGKYRDVILPMTVLRRLDAVLEPTKQAVLDMKTSLDKAKIVHQDQALRQAAGQAFYNTSKFTLRDLKARASQQQLKADFEAYLDGFSPNVQDILDNFEFRNQISRLSKADALGTLIEKFLSPEINLSSNPLWNGDGSITGIATYIWVLSNRKPDHRAGRVQLIDATQWFKPLRKNLGKKNCELSDEDIARICDTFLAFKETEQSKIFPNAAFGYWKVTVERPLRCKGIEPGRAHSPKEIKTLKETAERADGNGKLHRTIRNLPPSKEERYDWIEKTLTRFRYSCLGKADKGLVLGFLRKVSGYSRIQTKRLVKQYLKHGRIRRHKPHPAKGFTRKYTREDIRWLAHLDGLHGALSGPTTKKLCERAYAIFGQGEYERLAGISVAHLYN